MLKNFKQQVVDLIKIQAVEICTHAHTNDDLLDLDLQVQRSQGKCQ